MGVALDPLRFFQCWYLYPYLTCHVTKTQKRPKSQTCQILLTRLCSLRMTLRFIQPKINELLMFYVLLCFRTVCTSMSLVTELQVLRKKICKQGKEDYFVVNCNWEIIPLSSQLTWHPNFIFNILYIYVLFLQKASRIWTAIYRRMVQKIVSQTTRINCLCDLLIS